jgi:ribonucleoside-triphosphate reductase
VGQWLYNKFDKISGVSFLPYSEHTYQQAPYEPIDLETYEKLKEEFPETIEWNISENSDMTEGSQTLACTGNNCETLLIAKPFKHVKQTCIRIS